MNLEEKRKIEKEKYIKLYRKKPSYGDSDHSKPMRDYIISNLKPKSLLDVGCGGGQFVDFCKSQNVDARGVDIASPYDIVAPAHDIPLEDKSVEYLTAFDMLEHLVEEEVDEVLQEFVRLTTKGFIFTIAYKQSVGKGVDGELLHPTIKPESWWVDKIIQHSGMKVEIIKQGVKDWDNCLIFRK